VFPRWPPGGSTFVRARPDAGAAAGALVPFGGQTEPDEALSDSGMTSMSDDGRLPPTASGVLLNFVWMSVCFSLNHGCVTSCLALASAQLGPALGGYSSGILYLFYTMTALLVAPAVVQRLGAKGSLQGGLLLYCLYVGSYALALFAPAYRWPAVLVGAALGGLAAGWLWTAQGGYFAASAALYAHVLQVAPEAATSYLSGIFATLYLGLELALKLISTAVLAAPRDGGDVVLFTIYTAIALLSAVGICCIQPIAAQPPEPTRAETDLAAPDQPPSASSGPRVRSPAKALLAVDLMLRSRELWLLAPINTSFGFMASYLNFYVNGVLVKGTLGARASRGIRRLHSLRFRPRPAARVPARPRARAPALAWPTASAPADSSRVLYIASPRRPLRPPPSAQAWRPLACSRLSSLASRRSSRCRSRGSRRA
jgi:hypothetical protein